MLNRVDLALLSLLTLFWGINWPVMKFAVLDYPPLTFRMISMALGVLVIAVYIRLRKESFDIPKPERKRVLTLTVGNMLVWHICAIMAITYLTSGRAAIVGYTMPVWALMASVLFFKGHLNWRGLVGVALALIATLLLSVEEFSSLAGQPIGLMLMLAAAIGWGVGTAMMNHMKVSISNASLTFWMMVFTSTVLLVLALVFERSRWRPPTPGEWAAILYNATAVFGFCHIVWFRLARKLPPVASSLSIMLIPPLGVFSGAWALNERVGAYDITALALILAAMAVVLMRKKATEAAPIEH